MKYEDLTKEQKEHFDMLVRTYGEPPSKATHFDENDPTETAWMRDKGSAFWFYTSDGWDYYGHGEFPEIPEKPWADHPRQKVNKIEYKPWEEYPEIWKTEAEFWSYLRGALRRGVWEKNPIKLSFKNANCDPPPEGYTGRAKSGQYCALSGEWTGKSKLEVDHKDGNKSLLSWDDVLPFILHLVPPEGSLQLVSKEAHKIKSYAERMGISFEEAIVEKRVIQMMKEVSKKDLDKLLEEHDLPCNNDKVRRESLRELVEEGLI